MFIAVQAKLHFESGGRHRVDRCAVRLVSVVISNCVITAWAATFRGGVYGGTLNHCVFQADSRGIGFGGGALGSVLNDCGMIVVDHPSSF